MSRSARAIVEPAVQPAVSTAPRAVVVARIRPPKITGEVTGGVLAVKVECLESQAENLGLGEISAPFAEYISGQLLNLTGSGQLPDGPFDTRPVNALMHLAAAACPQDELEAALAVQMAMLHHCALECGRRALATGATLEGRALNLSQAGKLSRSFAQLLDALNRHRGKVTTQRVIVENFVQNGGQAVVGNVALPGGRGKTERSGPCKE